MKTLSAFVFLIMQVGVLAQESPARIEPPRTSPVRAREWAEPLGHTVEGTFFNEFIVENRRTGTRKVGFAHVLELKDGRFRLWQVNGSNKTQQAWSILESGNYTTNGGTVTFVAARNPKYKPMTNQWTFMMYKGQTSLWINGVLDEWNKKGNLNMVGVHFLTDRKPEDIVAGK